MASKELSVLFPCCIGDLVYSFIWDAPNSQYAIVEAKCIGFNIRSNEGYGILLRGEKFEYLRGSEQYKENWFTSLDDAKIKLELLNQK